jgi:hypothetical protein
MYCNGEVAVIALMDLAEAAKRARKKTPEDFIAMKLFAGGPDSGLELD